MEMYVVFGLPGVGKTFVGKVLQEHFGFYFHDADEDLPSKMVEAIGRQEPITDSMRDTFFQTIAERMDKLKKQHEKVVIAQTFIKDTYRKKILSEHPETKFIFVQADDAIRETRLSQRRNYPLDLSYARQMRDNFDSPTIPYVLLNNDQDGSEQLVKQLHVLLK